MRGIGGRPLFNGQGGRSPELLEGGKHDELERFVSCEAAQAAFLFVLGHSDFSNASVEIGHRAPARGSDARVFSAQAKSSRVNIGRSMSLSRPEPMRAVRK